MKENGVVDKRVTECEESNKIQSCFFSMSPKQFALLASLLGIMLTENLDLDQQNSLGNFIVSIGQSLLTAAAQGQSKQSSDQGKDRYREQIKLLKNQITLLEKEMNM